MIHPTFPNQPDVFNDWWAEQLEIGIDPDQEDMARQAWNVALETAAEEVGTQTGTLFGFQYTLRA